MLEYKRGCQSYLQSLTAAAAEAAGDDNMHISSAAGSESDIGEPADNARAERTIWEVCGGYSHKQPGSRLVQYGK